MKHVVFGCCGGMMILLFSVLLLTLQNRSVREEELKQSVAEAMDLAMEQAAAGMFSDGEEFSAYFQDALTEQITSDSELDITMLYADAEKGILSTEVKEMYRYPNGKTGSVSCKRTMIREEHMSEKTDRYEVDFYLDKADLREKKDCYKTYSVADGDVIAQPVAPSASYGRGVFREWRDAFDDPADFSRRVSENQAYYAVFE